jgi:hypothetical protein
VLVWLVREGALMAEVTISVTAGLTARSASSVEEIRYSSRSRLRQIRSQCGDEPRRFAAGDDAMIERQR